MSPLAVALVACAALAAACWLLGRVTHDCSWVDRLWSLAPPLYIAWFTVSASRLDARLLLMTVLAVAWGGRLTYNFARKGGYRAGGEDYRWAALRRRMSPRLFSVFHVVFICAYQNLLLLLLALPAWAVASRPPSPLGLRDAVAAASFVLFLVGETVADEQQWRFQSDKRARRDRGEPVVAEFVTTGLFRYSRHPNFFCEQGMWWSMALFAPLPGISLVGPALLTALFLGSTKFTEAITLSRYASYADYQRRTSRLVPWPPRA